MASRRHSNELLKDLDITVRSALRREGVINVPAIAHELNARHAGEARCLPEMESQVLAAALQLRAVILFQSPVHRRRSPPHGERMDGREG